MEIINGILKLNIGRENGPTAYRLSIDTLGESVNTSFRTGVPELEPFFENVSRAIQHLVMTRNIDTCMIEEIENITKTNFPVNNINWEKTHLMVNYVKEFKSLFSMRMSKVTFEKNGPFINILDPVRMEKKLQIKTEILKQMNNKYKPGIYPSPSVP